MDPLIKVTLDYERETKRFWVYADPTGTLMPAKIYVPKREGQTAPPQATLTVEA